MKKKLDDYLLNTKQLAESGDCDAMALWSLCIIELDHMEQFVTQGFIDQIRVQKSGGNSHSWYW